MKKKIIIKKTSKNGGYGFGNNYGIKFLKENLNVKYVVVSNPDAFFTNKMVLKLLDIAQDKDAAIVSGVQRINGKSIKDIAWKVPTVLSYGFTGTKLEKFFDKYNYYPDEYFESNISQVDCVPGAMYLVDADKFIDVGGFDEEMFLFCEETTIGFKLKKKHYRTFLVNDVFYDHKHSTSVNKNLPKIKQQYRLIYKNRLLFMKKYLHANKYVLRLIKMMYNYKIDNLK